MSYAPAPGLASTPDPLEYGSRSAPQTGFQPSHATNSGPEGFLVTSDGAPGIIKAIEVCFPRAARQRCLAHRMRNLAVKVPEDVWPEFKVRM